MYHHLGKVNPVLVTILFFYLI